ncbi:MAG TPA: peptidyl-prolyl cis-trans isomerase [Vicinamibacteria bacterium]|nr:peptidyl-prolyl cis-trans isomerase [Vicinamibacteria bacterium]
MKPPPVALAASLVLTAPALRAEVLERVIVKVNGAIVTQSEFENRQVGAVQAARVGPERIEAFLRDNNARILQEAIDELILVQRADEIGIRAKKEYTDDVIESIRKENNIADEEALKAQLRREGMTVSDLRRNIERSLLRREVLRREVEPKVALTDADVRAEYERRREEFTKPAQVRLLEILVGAESPDPLAEARELAARCRAGEDFAALARELSKAPSRAAGGDLGLLALAELQPSIRQAAERLKPGEISEPIAGADGSQRILKLQERSEAGTRPFDDVKAELRRQMADTRFSSVYEEYMKGLRQKAIIDVRVREVPLQVSVPATSILDPPEPEKAKGDETASPAPAESDAEFVTSPQAAPEKVAPPAGGTEPEQEPKEEPPR